MRLIQFMSQGPLDRPRPDSSGHGATGSLIRFVGPEWRDPSCGEDAMTDLTFDGKVAIITGAGGGLGKSHALELARRGARIVVNDLGGSVDGTGDNASAAQLVVDEITAAGGEAVADHNSVATAEGGAAIVKQRRRCVRHRRHPHQQRRHPARQDVPQHDARHGQARPRRPPARRLLRDPAGVADHAREELRAHRQHQLELGSARQLRPGQLRRRQARPRRLHPGARQRGPQAQHQGQRHRPGGPHPHDRGPARTARRQARSVPGHARPSSTSPTRTCR